MTFQFSGFQHRLHMDFETYSECDIKSAGAHAYAQHPSTEVLMLAYAIDDGPKYLWCPAEGEPMPDALKQWLAYEGAAKVAFNAAFERLIFKHVLGIDIPAEQWRCTMVASYYLGFTGGLDMIGKQMGLMEQKDQRGQRLIQIFSKPTPKNYNERRYTHENRPAEWQEFKEYCLQDVETERSMLSFLTKFPLMDDFDWKRYALDQRINDRGVYVDLAMAKGAVQLWDVEKEQLEEALRKVTGLAKVTRGPFASWLSSELGFEVTSLAKANVDALRAEASERVVKAIDLWQEKEGKAVAKYTAVINGACEDGRARGLFQFKGASRTDRTAGRRIQLQNLKRSFASDDNEIRPLVQAIRDHSPARLKLLSGMSVSEALGGTVRHVLQPKPGYSFVQCDLSSIESVVLGWLTMCDSILDTFRAGRDTYKEFAWRYYGITYDEVTKAQRTFAKPPVLGCFAADTRVLTKERWKRIVEVTPEDLLWDGEEWVHSDGWAYMGVKEVVGQHGVRATPDHKILTEEGWVEWQHLAGDGIEMATSLVSGKLSASKVKGTGADVPAASSKKYPQATSPLAAQSHASPAPIGDLPVKGQPQRSWASLNGITTDSPIDSMQQERDVKTLKIPRTKTTGQGAFGCTSPQQKSGLRTLSALKGGVTAAKRSIGLTMNWGTRRGTFASPTGEATQITLEGLRESCTLAKNSLRRSFGRSIAWGTKTVAQFLGNSRRGSHRPRLSDNHATVYDIINCGPRNRFTIWTDRGPVIAHNCGYMLGWKGLIAYAEGYGVTMDEGDSRRAVDTFRTMYPEIPKFWTWINDAVKYVTQTGQPLEGYRLRIERDAEMLRIWLPSGRALSYFRPDVTTAPAPWAELVGTYTAVNGDELRAAYPHMTDDELVRAGLAEWSVYVHNFSYMGADTNTNVWTRQRAHAGLLTENIVQSIAMDILFDGIERAEAAGLAVVSQVHDELVSEVPEGTEAQSLATLKQCMTTLPWWGQDLWLGGDGYIAKFYKKD